VVLFVHGGAWKRGGRDDNKMNGHAHVGRSFARRGYVCAVPTYRLSAMSTVHFYVTCASIAFGLAVLVFLVAAAVGRVFWLTNEILFGDNNLDLLQNFAFVFLPFFALVSAALSLDEPRTPSVKYPENVADVAEALRWLRDNVSSFGGDPENIWLAGHSAGAQMASLLYFHPRHLRAQGLAQQDVRGLVLVSGCFNIPRLYSLPIASSLFCVPSFGRDASVHRDATPMSHVVGPCGVPFLVLNAQWDFHLHRDSNEMVAALRQAGAHVETDTLAGYSHRSIMSTRDLVVGHADRFIRAHLPKQPAGRTA
jgi:acetyl esterase/lipase